MTTIKWIDNYIQVTPSNRPKKITGTQLPTVLGLDPWGTPFKAWCRCTRTYEPPFEGNKYTNAGQVIEPKVFEFLRKSMGYGLKVVTPEDLYGKDYFNKTRGDFYHENPIFGGMWDALIMGDDGKPEYVVEIKTVQVDGRSGSLADRWKDGEAPHYQALQASLYAYLLGIDKVLMVAVALEDKKGDYEHPEQVVPSYANSNVYIDEFRVSKRYPNFSLLIEQAIGWWEMYVLTGVSPEYDSKLDKDIISALKTNFVDASADIQSLINEVEQLKNEIDSILTLKGVNAKQKRVDELTKLIKQYAMEQFRPNDNTVSFIGKTYNWVMTKSDTVELDKESLKRDGLYDKYLIPKTNYRLTPSKIKEDK